MRLVALLASAVVLLSLWGGQACAKEGERELSTSLRIKLAKVETRLEDQVEAADRQGEAFDAAVSRIEMVNAALVAVIALAALGGGFLAVRWVRQTAQEQIAIQVEKAGEKVFEAEAASLREEYDAEFAALYRRFKRLTEP